MLFKFPLNGFLFFRHKVMKIIAIHNNYGMWHWHIYCFIISNSYSSENKGRFLFYVSCGVYWLTQKADYYTFLWLVGIRNCIINFYLPQTVRRKKRPCSIVCGIGYLSYLLSFKFIFRINKKHLCHQKGYGYGVHKLHL